MKKTIATLLLIATLPSAAGTLAVGATINADTTGSQTITVNPSGATGVQFTSFTMNLSKGVSMGAADDAANNQVLIGAKHFNSTKVYGGRTGGGAIAECTAVASVTANSNLSMPTVNTTTGAC